MKKIGSYHTRDGSKIFSRGGGGGGGADFQNDLNFWRPFF